MKAITFLKSRIFLISNVVFLLAILPAFGTALGAPSMSYGALVSAIVIMSCGIYRYKSESIYFFQGRVLKILISIPFFVLSHTLLIIFLQNQTVDFSRLLFSLSLLEIILISIVFIHKFIADLNQKDFDVCIRYIFALLTLMAFLGIFGFFSFGREGIPLVFFNEPSHFSLVFTPFFLWSLYRASNVLKKSLILLLVFYIAVLAPSMCLLLIVIGATFIVMKFKHAIIALLILLISYSGTNFLISYSGTNTLISSLSSLNMNGKYIFSGTSGKQYYQKRLPTLNEDTKLFNLEKTNYFELPRKYLNHLVEDSYNGSLLVMISGWQRAVFNLEDSQALGFGFQQFGIRGRWGNATDKLVYIYQLPLCLKDGGSIAPKVIGELGIFGILLVLVYIKFSFSKFKEFRRYSTNSFHYADLKYVFFVASIISFVVSLFIRGVGYFTTESFLFFLGMFGVLIKTQYGRSS
jgi:hypothetical protein